jgi:hypothetical protein
MSRLAAIFSLPAVVGLAGCGTAAAPLGGGAASAAHVRGGGSWIDPAAKSGSLTYVSDQYEKTVFVYSYPKLKLVGSLTGFQQPDGECVDAGGDVWIADYLASQLVEYAHGSDTPKTTLSDPGNTPYACAIDPKSGDLAAVNFGQGYNPGSISIYKNAAGSPKVYVDDSLAVPFFDAYDSRGKLYVDGILGPYSPNFTLASFAGGAFTTINLNQAIDSPGDVVVVGSRVNVADSFRYTHSVYGFAVKGSQGRLIGTTHLGGTNVVEEFAVVGNALVAANVDQTIGSAMVFNYPKGGAAKRVFGKGTLEAPIGLVISR